MVGLYDLLPLIIRIHDKQASGQAGQDTILQKLFAAFDDERDAMLALIEGMRDLLSPRTTTDLCLSLLANFLGVTEFPFSEVAHEPQEYVQGLVAAHRMKGTILSILKEMHARDITSGVFIHELWKETINAVDEYVPNASDVPYPDDAYKSARVIFVEGTEGPVELSDGETTGEYAVGQYMPYSEAKGWRDRLNNVFPIHVLVPPPVIRTAFEDQVDEIGDYVANYIYALFRDDYRVEQDELTVLTQCIANCQVSCQERCETLCELTCETSCETSCQAACEEDCEAVCQTFCQTTCELTCQDACQSFCQSECQSTCQGACESGCQQACQFECQNATENCQSFCEFNCQTDREVACSEQCQNNCQTAAQDPCDGGPPVNEG